MDSTQQQIKDLAPYCNISMRMATILHRFFLYVTSHEEEEEMDNWINERKEHSELFDLLCHENIHGSISTAIQFLKKVANRQAGAASRTKKILRLLFGADD